MLLPAQVKMPQFDSTNMRKVLGKEKGGKKYHCGIVGEHGVGTRFSKSTNVVNIVAAVTKATEALVPMTLRKVLATGYTANDPARLAANTAEIVVIDLPLMRNYWPKRLRESAEPTVAHLQ